MRVSSAFVWVSLIFSWGCQAQSSSVDAYLASESPIAKAALLANIGPSGSKALDAKSGVVIASPSRSNPNYMFTWIRDASLVFGVIIEQVTQGFDKSLRSQIDNFVASQKLIQQVSNPSGTVASGGLGEPKFEVDGTAFHGRWHRPQRDGPALRASALITWANSLLKEGNTTYVTDTLWPIIKLDLDYVADSWNRTTADLWEEINSSSFYTTAVQHRSLRQGITLANAIGQNSTVSGYPAQADNVLCFLQSYWNSAGFMTSNTGGGRSGIDANSVLASIHTFDAAAGCDSATFQPCSDRALANLVTYVDSFRSIYSINSGVPANAAVATGRYPEDTYMGGHPWYLTTLAVAEQLYDALIVWKQQGSITVTETSKSFFSLFSPGIAAGEIPSSSSTFETLTTAIRAYADGFVAVVAKHTPSDGALAEQYHRDNGSPLSAVDLTWSYASLLTAHGTRNGVVPASWGAKGLTVPTVCSPNKGGFVEGIPITFNIQATTVEGESIFLSGSIDALNNWSPGAAIALRSEGYPIWTAVVSVLPNTPFEYKFLRKSNGVVTWQSNSNQQFTSPASGDWVLNDVWQ